MAEIQKTLNITEALNERINVFTEDIRKYERDLGQVKKKNAVIIIRRRFLFAMAILCWVFAALYALALIGYKGDIFVHGCFACLIFLGGLGFNNAKKKYKKDNDTEVELLKKINEVSNKLNKVKREKRDMVLQYETEIKHKQDEDIITENFKAEPDLKECPMCAEMIKAKAKLCRYCGHKFENSTNET